MTNEREMSAGGEAEAPVTIDDGDELAAWLASKDHEGGVVRTRLKTNDRVIARVTDGIYRQPGSALRELISNAWDADATEVTILTDAPRFSRIYVRDDGDGMTYTVLARLLHSIGGSAKRSAEGRILGVTSEHDPNLSRRGRPLIGKIGIGLFSVSQLGRRFQIVTKVAGEEYRLVADVRLRTYSEDREDDPARDDGDEYVSGEVDIRREPAADTSAHGTDIVIYDVKPRVRDLLRSADRWRSVLDPQDPSELTRPDGTGLAPGSGPPRYHTGYIAAPARASSSFDAPALLAVTPSLPWSDEDPPDARMGRLVSAVQELSESRVDRPDLATVLDTYLETLWTLALSAPVRYVGVHPFDLTREANVRCYWLSNANRGRAQEVDLRDGERVRDAVRREIGDSAALEDGSATAGPPFRVVMDGTELRRPVRFDYVQASRGGPGHSLLFIGKYHPNLAPFGPAASGGDLGFEGYLFWTGRIVPKENNGVLLRIRGASGAAFDPTFLKYQVSEQTRLRQITSELFVQRGLDPALNIDRESFNFAHPHVQVVALWLHGAIRQLTNRLKELSAQARSERRAEEASTTRTRLAQFVEAQWTELQPDDPLPDVVFAPDAGAARTARAGGSFAFARAQMQTLAQASGAVRAEREEKAAALVQVLAAFGVLDGRPYEEQERLLDALLAVCFDTPAAPQQ